MRLLAFTSFALASAHGALRLFDGPKTPCPPDCVLAQWTFTEAVTECSGCVPENSKWRCPSQGNKYHKALEAQNRVGLTLDKWSTEDCVHKSYSPAWFAFAGPGPYEADVVPACPTAQYCACGEVKKKMTQLLFTSNDLPIEERSGIYWAGLASNFTAWESFDPPNSGASWTQYDLTYTHADGRVQFCAGVQSFTYGPQEGSFETKGSYDSRCAWRNPSCYWAGFAAANERRGDCWWPRTKATCTAEVGVRVEALPPDHVQSLVRQPPLLSEWSACTPCGDGTRSRHCVRIATEANATCSGTTQEACSECGRWVGDYEWVPECPAGYDHVSTAWSWGRRKYTCHYGPRKTAGGSGFAEGPMS